ncbi:MAG: conjugal transfer protein TraX [Lachnospiraceae bacterium]|jgi:hypothetical protein|nr:conjugal transfer protein TraX [Lachnospiraceae bacterium]
MKRGLSGFALKMIAIVTMLIDHIGYVSVFVFPYRLGNGEYYFYHIARTIGRVSFPLFCFLLVEGAIHTSSRIKYAWRLLVFALISEIPYNLAFYRRISDWTMQNVFLTLLIGLGVVSVMQRYRPQRYRSQRYRSQPWDGEVANGHGGKPEVAGNRDRGAWDGVAANGLDGGYVHGAPSGRRASFGSGAASDYGAASRPGPATHTGGPGLKDWIPCVLVWALAYVVGCALALALRTDYDWMGVTLITILYLCKDEDVRGALWGIWCRVSGVRTYPAAGSQGPFGGGDTQGGVCAVKQGYGQPQGPGGGMQELFGKWMTLALGGAFSAYISWQMGIGAGLLAFIPIWYYDGRRGWGGLKYAFYAFYPLHLLALYIITTAVMRPLYW